MRKETFFKKRRRARIRIFFKGFNFAQDGPGNRLVYHLQGCNLHCPWCSNPEGMPFDGGYECTEDQILDECIRSRAMFFSGGGVTFTGGEATMQADALLAVLKKLKAQGIHTALETNGTPDRLPEIAAYIDYLMMDFKHFNADAFLHFTGAPIHALQKNYAYFCSIGRQLHIRIPLIRHVNAENPRGFAEYFSGFDNRSTVFELLPYHEFGKSKWTAPYTVEDGFVTPAQISEFHKIFESYGLKIITS